MGEHPRLLHPMTTAQGQMHLKKVVEIGDAVPPAVRLHVPAQPLDASVVHPSGQDQLEVPVDQRATGAPETIPEDIRIAGLWVPPVGLSDPMKCQR